MTQHHKPTNKRSWDNTQYSQKPVQKRGKSPKNGGNRGDFFAIHLVFTVIISFGLGWYVFSGPDAQQYNNIVTHALIALNGMFWGRLMARYWQKLFP